MKIPYPKALMLIVFLAAISCEDKFDVNKESKDVVNFRNASTIITTPLYDGSVERPINLNLTKSWTANFQETIGPDEIQSHYYGRDVIDQILAQKGCTGLRIFYALKDTGEKVLIISGVDDKGENLLPVSQTVSEGENILADMSWPCPPYCPPKGL